MKSQKRTSRANSAKLKPLVLTKPHLSSEWLTEPDLCFADGRTHPDPKVGIPLYGPRSLGTSRHKQEVHVGIIGTSDAVENARVLLERSARGVPGDHDHAPFPGFTRDLGFRSELRLSATAIEPITRNEAQALLSNRNRRRRFEEALSLLEHKMELLTGKDHPLDYVVVVLPEDIYTRCRVADYVERGVGKVHRDLHRAFKALAMRFQKPTQMLLESTTGLTETDRDLDHPSLIAWNLFTGLYFKVDGLPWGPTGLPPASCHVGVSFFRPLGQTSTLRSSVVQAFDENGEGLVLRGHDFHWDEEKQGKSPHLSEELAGKLIEVVLGRYKDERKQLPRRLVLHKTSRFEAAERRGFEEALKKVDQYDLVALTPVSDVRLVRTGRYPPLRGTAFTIGDISYLYTSGYLPTLGRYPHGHVPSPLQIADHVGDTPKPQLLKEIMVLTKMNWNSANLSGLMPITLRFARLVGDILREVPAHHEPQSKYKYYM